MENLKKHRAEYLSSDILEENFIKSFSPFHVVQTILGSSRVDIRDRFVSPLSRRHKIIAAFSLIITLLLYIYIIHNYAYNKFNKYPAICFITTCSTSAYYFIFLCNIINVRFVNADANQKFYLLLQEIDRIMKIDQNDKIYQLLFLNNLGTIISSTVFLAALFFIAIYENFILILGFSGMLYSMLCCIIEWLCCADLLVYFFLRLRFINAIIINHIEGNTKLKKSKNTFNFPVAFVCMRRLALETHHFKTSKTHVYLKALFDGYLSFQHHCRWQMLLFFTNFFVQSMLIIEFSIMALQNDAMQWLELVTLPSAIGVCLILGTVICARCEFFFREVQQTKRLCITILSQNFEGPLRTKAKTMLKMIENQPPQFSVYNMWDMNASAMLKMLNIITTLAVALLQFAFL
ncbi:uncharacterized protein LOC123691892 [Colias croceus]|uniref:uncharacterized protein LOC123691892 n=1 Tax=Colias crocea TaxID=72248 RepID=UPI001E27AB99|nr:uncharacterized protein LOC123691892 [Colias croceus]